MGIHGESRIIVSTSWVVTHKWHKRIITALQWLPVFCFRFHHCGLQNFKFAQRQSSSRSAQWASSPQKRDGSNFQHEVVSTVYANVVVVVVAVAIALELILWLWLCPKSRQTHKVLVSPPDKPWHEGSSVSHKCHKCPPVWTNPIKPTLPVADWASYKSISCDQVGSYHKLYTRDSKQRWVILLDTSSSRFNSNQPWIKFL